MSNGHRPGFRVAGVYALGKDVLATIPQASDKAIAEVLANDIGTYEGNAKPVSRRTHREIMAVRDAIRAAKQEKYRLADYSTSWGNI